jgi:hypothetical protein
MWRNSLHDLRRDDFAWAAPCCEAVDDEEALLFLERCVKLRLPVVAFVSVFLLIFRAQNGDNIIMLALPSRVDLRQQVVDASLLFCHCEESWCEDRTVKVRWCGRSDA